MLKRCFLYLSAADRRGNSRVYGADIFQRLSLIRTGEERRIHRGRSAAGWYTGIARDATGPRWRGLADRKLTEIEEHIAEAQRVRTVLQAVIGCECPSFEDCTRAGC